ncbi:MAG: NUDIX domain-containing protein [Chlamydiae bacterium]|nr:NUDIX domain-containing protein [Chlamydiota bacterium]
MGIVQDIKGLITSIPPFDELEKKHLLFAKEWIESGAGIFRMNKPATPDPHLVAYFLLLDEAEKKVLLVSHKKADLWLPAGGHVEPNEHPFDTVKREIQEELFSEADFLLPNPFFLTVTETAKQTPSHTDVSLWYLLNGNSKKNYQFDQDEFYEIAWFRKDEIPYKKADPHMQRCIYKLEFLHFFEM